VIFCFCSFVVIYSFPSFTNDSGVTSAAIKKIQINMNIDQVIQELGTPEKLEGSDVIIDKNGNARPLHPNRMTYIYKRYTPWHTTASTLYVHFDNGKVSMVYGKIKNLLGMDDSGVYMISKDSEIWEHVDFTRAFPNI
jgi:hypothetical protein